MYRPRHVGRTEIDHGIDPAASIRHPDHRRGYKYERMKHPDLSHEQLVVLVDRRLMGDRHAYDADRIAEERRSRYRAHNPGRCDSCATCAHFHPFLDDPRGGICGNEQATRFRKTIPAESCCADWEQHTGQDR
jgi:hypothetical protein